MDAIERLHALKHTALAVPANGDYTSGYDVRTMSDEECAALDAAIAALDETRWRDVREELPPNGDHCLVALPWHRTRVGMYIYDCQEWFNVDGGWGLDSVTHWRPFTYPDED